MRSNDELVDSLVRSRVLKTQLYIEAFRKVDRAEFMWPGYEKLAYEDTPAPLGETGQTISAPHMNAYYLEILNIHPDDVVLEVGAGSGYQAALIGKIIELGGGSGHIYSIEYLYSLYRFAIKNIEKLGLRRHVTIVYGDGSLGWPPKQICEIYDKILVSAAAKDMPKYLTKQLKNGGRMLIPIGRTLYQILYLIERRDGEISKRELFPVAFVPLQEGVYEYGDRI